jgi:type I restriction enzyme R subunit
MTFNENTAEEAALEWLQGVGYQTRFGPNIAPNESASERDDYRESILPHRLAAALPTLNPHIPLAVRAVVFADVVRRVGLHPSNDLMTNNHAVHQMLTDGVDVSYTHGGAVRYDKVWLVDFDQPSRNDFCAVNQYTVHDVNQTNRARTERRPDIALFVNGLPLVVIELKNPADEKATIEMALSQLDTYKQDIPSFMAYTALSVISDGLDARLGTLTGGWEWFKAWRTVDGQRLDPYPTQLQTLIEGVLSPHVLLDLIHHFVVFEQSGSQPVKKVASYHQYHAVNKAVHKTLEAVREGGTQKVGVIWHTQGSGKSLSMLFYAGKIIRQAVLQNPTVVMLTDRNDLDDQLFATFSAGAGLLRQTPTQAESRDDLREKLRVASGGVVFTTLQKFGPDPETNLQPVLSERRNIVFIADEAHRSQYGFEARMVNGQVSYGFAKYVRDALPNASFIGFTGTPIETADANTRHVFGDYIDVYDIQRAIDDGATVPIYYEARLARIRLREEMIPRIDPEFEEITEGEEESIREKLKTKWSQLEAMVGTKERLEQVAADIVAHFEQRQSVMKGKGMIVCMSRRIAVDLYDTIVRLRPSWHDPTDEGGAIKVVMTGSASDPQSLQPHIRNKARRKAIAERFKTYDDPLQLVIVRDMWLTGFDVPPLHTLYVDKPMGGHNLMQAIARVNRVFRDKPGGLVVDYLGIATELQKAVQAYTSAGSPKPTTYQREAVDAFLNQLEIARGYFHRFDIEPFFTGTPAQRLNLIPAAEEHVLSEGEERKKTFLSAIAALTKLFALAVPDEAVLEAREEVAFYQAVRAALVKHTITGERPFEELHLAVKQIVSEAVSSDGVIDVFGAAGLKSPDVSILSDEFLEGVRHLPHRNLALELLRKLLNDEIKARGQSNVVRSRAFSERLQEIILAYQNRTIDGSQVIAELIGLAKDIRDDTQRGVELNLTPTEMAFYDALAENKSAVEVMGDKRLAVIAAELVMHVRQNVTVDWSVKETARAKLRVLVKRILRQFGYPPDLEEAATKLVLQQAELMAAVWVSASA